MMILGLTAPPGDPSRMKLSAEERLLQVIQSGGESPFAGKGGGGGFVQKIWSVFKQGGPAPGKKPVPGSGLGRLNKILGTVIVLGLILAVINAFYFKPDISRMHSLVAGTRPPEGQVDLNPIPVEEFLTPITSRNLFQPKTEEPPPPDAPAVPPPGPAAPSGVFESLQLVGIAWGTRPEAMIREKSEGRTFFLKQGDELKGVLVKEILRDRVIVEYEGETKEIL
ncbi:MAG: hypothetical protein HY541_07260 [Deltaproteobacteria bacterium]|nr:hypothetical protein [Deltaproteobacteria bacterium]